MGNYFTPGFGADLQGDDLLESARVAVDTGRTSATGGPMAGGMKPGTQILASGKDAITAKAGGGKSTATQLGYGVNEITVCATAANSVLLPYAFPGATVYVFNDGVASAQVFGKGTDVVDGIATGTGVAQAAAKRAVYVGIAGTGDGSDAGSWISMSGAKTS